MRAFGGFVVSVLAVGGAGLVGALAAAACTYTSSGQGGAAADLQVGDATAASNDAGLAVGSSGSGDNGGSSNGGGSSTGSSSGGSVTGGSSSSGGSGVSGGSSGGTGEPDAALSCPAGQVVCGDGCCPAPVLDSGPPSCTPPPSFLNDCRAYVGDQDAGTQCSACIASGACAQPTCVPSTCTQTCGGAGTADKICACVAACIQQQSGSCCLQTTDQYFSCVTAPCASACAN